ncbi:response regulator transcription factor [Dinghuibacter silviterrae]|uniref:DNA-binding response OmpR family regulator n=1 Tax=Dinghuibacter silviterrae TaxID=1539049 RepID=A0A4R8DG77_9BACT|nr:response regulator transcription factor [Dinghuibacter silviterrae]TDW96457.1 DNA-binding response OmpR family regulator [Dinghuibacter silviterrae]
MESARILLVEDERKIAESLQQGLGEQQFSVDIARDGLEGKKRSQETPYDLYIIDINLPLLDGYELCRLVRASDEHAKIILLTALGTTEHKLNGFQAGADDYIVKPFDFKELVARVGVLLRRSPAFVAEKRYLHAANLTMYLDTQEVTRDGLAIALTAKEFQLLEYLVRNKNKIVSRVDIARDVWDIDWETRTNVIDVYVNFLRKKIDRDFNPKLIHTLVGRGYILKDHLL